MWLKKGVNFCSSGPINSSKCGGKRRKNACFRDFTFLGGSPTFNLSIKIYHFFVGCLNSLPGTEGKKDPDIVPKLCALGRGAVGVGSTFQSGEGTTQPSAINLRSLPTHPCWGWATKLIPPPRGLHYEGLMGEGKSEVHGLKSQPARFEIVCSLRLLLHLPFRNCQIQSTQQNHSYLTSLPITHVLCIPPL